MGFDFALGVAVTEPVRSSIQRLEQDAVVSLYELDATVFGAQLVYFSPTLIDGEVASFGGKKYIPLPITADGFEWSGSGTLPRPTLSVTAQDLSFLSLVLSSGDLVGAPVTRIRTYRKHLDDGSDPDTSATFPVDHYVVERKASQNSKVIQFELSVRMDQEGRQIPARQVLRDTCTHRYRFYDGTSYSYAGATCPYAGLGEWGVDGQAAPNADSCGKRLSDCKKRFGAAGVLPFYGFPGVGRYK